MNRAPRDRQGGFVLIEAIAVLALGALVMLTLIIAADLVTRQSAAAARRANQMETLATGLSALRRDIAGAKRIRVGDLKSPLLFYGRPTSLAFPVASDDADRGDGLVRVEAEYNDERGLLVRSAARLPPQAADVAAVAFGDPAVLLTGPWVYRFSYAAVSGGSLSWTSGWSRAREMPAAIRLEVVGRADSRRILPPLVVRLHVDAEPGCPESEGGLCEAEPVAAVESGEGADGAFPTE